MMQGVWEHEFRKAIIQRVGRVYGLTPVITIADAEDLVARMERLPRGRPVQVQDEFGHLLYLPGLDGPIQIP